MMKKAIIAGIVVIVLVCLAFVFLKGDGPAVAEEKPKPVRIMEIAAGVSPIVLDYTGVVSPEEVRKIGFKSPGRIARVFVEKGQYVSKGDILAKLDTKELSYAKQAAEQDVNKARDAYEYSQSLYERMENLYGEGAISLQDLETSRLERDLQQAALNQALVNCDNIGSSMGDAVIASGMDGYVADVLYKEGEIVPAGYPVLVIRGKNQVVNTGLAGSDAGKVVPGARVRANVDGIEAVGEVTSIDPVPDDSTRTYNAEILLEGEPFNIGSIARLEIILGEEEGVWIPVASVMVDGEDYVYIVEGDRAVKRKVALDGVRSSRVRVEGLSPGDNLVIEGYRVLRDGDRVVIHR